MRLCDATCGNVRSDMSGTTVAGIVLLAVTLAAVAIVAALFVWAALEDGRKQRRVDLRRRKRN
jgi:hypothetical protein